MGQYHRARLGNGGWEMAAALRIYYVTVFRLRVPMDLSGRAKMSKSCVSTEMLLAAGVSFALSDSPRFDR
jgi:hypothetical protein